MNQKSSLGIVSMISGIIGLCTSCLFFGIIPCLLGLILGIASIFEKNKSKSNSIVGITCSAIGIWIFIIISIIVNLKPNVIIENESNILIEENNKIDNDTSNIQNDNILVENVTEQNIEDENSLEINDDEIENKTETNNTEELTDKEEITELNEEDYKYSCKEIYYDDVFFGEDIDNGDFVKLNLMVSENYYFDADALYSTSFLGLMKEWSLYRDFKKCSVLRENEDSYAGKGKIDLYFSDKYEYNPEDYDLGSKIIVYGEIISFSNNTWDGYNSVVVVPKYIELE